MYTGSLLKQIEGKCIECRVVIKELFPKGIGIKRSKEAYPGLIIPDESAADFFAFRERFGKRFISFSEYARTPGSSARSDAFVYGEAGNTCYVIACPVRGRLLADVQIHELSLARIASVMEAVCRSIRSLHLKERLFLDMKPANILYDMSDDDMQARAYIIDFDTVQQLERIHKGVNGYYPYTPGWAPQEQVTDRAGAYRDPLLIGYHTDIYSIGAVFFFLLTGRAPKAEDIKAIKEDTFFRGKECRVLGEASLEAEELVKDMLGRMLEPDPVLRQTYFKDCLAVRVIEKEFANLYGITAGDDVHFEPVHKRISVIEDEIRHLKDEMKLIREGLSRIADALETRGG